MKILVCIKQISTSDICFNSSDKWFSQSNSRSFAISRFDENALEEAILLKEQLKARLSESASENGYSYVSVDAISVGGTTASESIKRAMGMGADNGIHLVTEEEGYVDAAVTASRLAAMIKKMGNNSTYYLPYDLILTGIMSEDLMQAQVGPMLSEYLQIPCVTSVVNAKLNQRRNSVNEIDAMDVQRELEGGMRQIITVKLPALLTIQAGINQPRYPSLSNILRANKKQINSIQVNELFCNQTNTSQYNSNLDTLKLIRFEYPAKKRDGRLLIGTINDKATELKSILKLRGVLI